MNEFINSTEEDIISMYTEYDGWVGNEEIINFAYLYDDKRPTTTLEDLEDKIVEKLQDSKDINTLKLFYVNHLDLFVKNQNKFQNMIKNVLFLDDYMKYRTMYADIKTFIDSITLYSELISPVNTPLLGIPQLTPTLLTRPHSAKMKKRLSDVFDKSYPSESIFSKIQPNDFAIKCHRMYLCYYFLSEMRQYQFYSRVSTREIAGYAHDFSNFYNNIVRKLELEVDIFCKTGQFSSLADIFIVLSNTFLELGNLPLAQVSINIMHRFQRCKEKKIEHFMEKHGIVFPLRSTNLNKYKKFSYLVEPDNIDKVFFTAQELENKIKTFSFIQQKLVKTKSEILNENIFSSKPSHEDFILSSYINPKMVIKEKLFKTTIPGGMDSACIQEKCDQIGGAFDKKYAKYPRKWSKEYCMKTPCHNMGFSQKSSCRYYKNCYT